MPDLSEPLKANREAVEELIQAAYGAASEWVIAPAPGKWSPSQLTEHVARSLEESGNLIAGRPTKFPTFPSFIRPLVRAFLFNRVLKQGKFPKARTNKPMDPENGPSTPSEAGARLTAACEQFERDCRTQAHSRERVQTGLFGEVDLGAFVRFTELHTRHHRAQLRRAPNGAEGGGQAGQPL